MPKKGHKWTKEQKITRSKQYTGSGNPFFGKKHGEVTRQSIGQFRKGVWNGFGFKNGHKPWNAGKHHSEETKKLLSEKTKLQWKEGRASREMLFRGGEAHQCWKGGISKKEFRKRLREQKAGKPRPKQCEICNEERKIFFDHDHETGKFRGWICDRCNCALGLAKDSSERLLLLAKYLKKYGK